VEFEWDDKKAKLNQSKHGVRFDEAASIWFDGNALEIPDSEHSDSEERWLRLGISRTLRILVVVFIEKVTSQRLRIISARKADRSEQAQYIERINHEK
jgi:uncharacterized protein